MYVLKESVNMNIGSIIAVDGMHSYVIKKHIERFSRYWQQSRRQVDTNLAFDFIKLIRKKRYKK